MSKTRTITVICWAISAAALLGLVVWIFISGIFSNAGLGFGGFGRYEPVETHTVSADNIDSMLIDWTSGAVIVRVHSGDDIQITEFAQRQLRENEHLELNTESGTVAINFTQHRVMRGNIPSKQLEVLIPHALSENFESFSIIRYPGASKQAVSRPMILRRTLLPAESNW